MNALQIKIWKKCNNVLQNRKLFVTLPSKKEIAMAQVEYITIKNASSKVLKKMRKIGEEKAQRLQDIQNRWDSGDYKDIEVVQL